MPYFARVKPNVLNASGYSGHGVALASLAGKIMAEAVAGQMGRFDLILNTVSGDVNHDGYISTLKRDGSYVLLGVPESALAVNAFGLLMKRKKVSASLIGGIRETQEMLDFCAEHGIVSEVEVIPISKVNEAYDRILTSDVRYRFVIDMATL